MVLLALVPIAGAQLVISEIMYNPDVPPGVAVADNDDLEFIEFHNIGGVPLDLSGSKLAGIPAFEFAAGTIIAPGELIVIVSNEAAFRQRYGIGFPVVGEYEGRLSNNGEDVELLDAANQMIARVPYDDSPPWQGRTATAGRSSSSIR